MKVLRLHKCRKHTLVLPRNWRESIALYLRGWRPAELLFVPVEWWEKPKKPRHDLAILLTLKVMLGAAVLAFLCTLGSYAKFTYEHQMFLKSMQEKNPPRKW